jgi:hypothetical protein
MKLIRNAILLGLTMGVGSMVGCSRENAPRAGGGAPSAIGDTTGVVGGTPHSAGQTGTVGLRLQLAPGLAINALQYTITNPTLAGFATIVNTVDVSGSQVISFSLTLPVATGYTVSLSGFDSHNDPCSGGPVAFGVVAGQSNVASLSLVCSQIGDGGVVGPDVHVATVSITADASLQTAGGGCAAVNGWAASPNEVFAGQAISLDALGVDALFQSSDVTLSWTATGGAGNLTGTTGMSTTFDCVSPGTETITVTAAITGTGASCPGTGSQTFTVTCDSLDGSTPDAGVDTGTPDTGVDTGTMPDTGDGSGPLAPCTTVGQTNCVQCQGNDMAPNANKTCTPTEAAIVAHDITAGHSTAAGPSPAGSCYTCLYNGGCIDDTHYGDTDHECEDSLAVGTAAECEDALACIFSSKCGATAVEICYCGTAVLSTTCQGNPATGPINGACDSQIATGDGFAVTDGTDNTAHLTDITRAGGKAVQIFQCSLTNSCAACQN